MTMVGSMVDVLTPSRIGGGALFGPGSAYRDRAAYEAANSYSFSDIASGQVIHSLSGAAGGFLLYPNKPNVNQINVVYGK
jgi:hypothetical protein